MDAEPLAAMIREDHADWKALVEALDAHPDATLHREGAVPWTSRDVYAHLARWIEHSTAALEARLHGRPPPADPEGTDDEINARWQAEDSSLTLDEARARAHRAFDQRLLAIERVPLDLWDAPLEAMARADGSEHYANHRRYISS
ncbi:MAG: maleylpyruvate isomerase N-terminal domain-containing protein [Dehalococcoidia bacterium]